MSQRARFTKAARVSLGQVLGALAVGLALTLAGSGCRTVARADESAGESLCSLSAQCLEQTWGVEVVALRLTAAGRMLDFRYKVLDPGKAAPLFIRAAQPELVVTRSGARLPVFTPSTIGPLRSTNPPLEGRTYFMLFPNPGLVGPGEQARLEIGDFQADLVVE